MDWGCSCWRSVRGRSATREEKAQQRIERREEARRAQLEAAQKRREEQAADGHNEREAAKRKIGELEAEVKIAKSLGDAPDVGSPARLRVVMVQLARSS